MFLENRHKIYRPPIEVLMGIINDKDNESFLSSLLPGVDISRILDLLRSHKFGDWLVDLNDTENSDISALKNDIFGFLNSQNTENLSSTTTILERLKKLTGSELDNLLSYIIESLKPEIPKAEDAFDIVYLVDGNVVPRNVLIENSYDNLQVSISNVKEIEDKEGKVKEGRLEVEIQGQKKSIDINFLGDDFIFRRVVKLKDSTIKREDLENRYIQFRRLKNILRNLFKNLKKELLNYRDILAELAKDENENLDESQISEETKNKVLDIIRKLYIVKLAMIIINESIINLYDYLFRIEYFSDQNQLFGDTASDQTSKGVFEESLEIYSERFSKPSSLRRIERVNYGAVVNEKGKVDPISDTLRKYYENLLSSLDRQENYDKPEGLELQDSDKVKVGPDMVKEIIAKVLGLHEVPLFEQDSEHGWNIVIDPNKKSNSITVSYKPYLSEKNLRRCVYIPSTYSGELWRVFRIICHEVAHVLRYRNLDNFIKQLPNLFIKFIPGRNSDFSEANSLLAEERFNETVFGSDLRRNPTPAYMKAYERLINGRGTFIDAVLDYFNIQLRFELNQRGVSSEEDFKDLVKKVWKTSFDRVERFFRFFSFDSNYRFTFEDHVRINSGVFSYIRSGCLTEIMRRNPGIYDSRLGLFFRLPLNPDIYHITEALLNLDTMGDLSQLDYDLIAKLYQEYRNSLSDSDAS